MREKFGLSSLFLSFFIYFFAVFETDFHGPDEPIYYGYTASVVEDGDLNAVNNLYRNHRHHYPTRPIEISKTYNLPDFHNHGGVVLWVPFYAYAKIIHSLAVKFNMTNLTAYGPERLKECLMSFSTVVFGFFTIFLTYMLCRVFFSNIISLASNLGDMFWNDVFLFFIV